MKIPTKRIKLENGLGYKNVPEFKSVVAIGEHSSGNDTVGDMWVETKIFTKETTLEEVINWAYASHTTGKLILTIPEE